jgi:hypothetical protein
MQNLALTNVSELRSLNRKKIRHRYQSISWTISLRVVHPYTPTGPVT